jgi:molecular chaperone GrpE
MTDIPNPTAADPVVESAADAPGGAQPADEVVARLQKERDEVYDRFLRLTAEFDNYRKRVERDRRDANDRATASSVEDLLPIVDDFERALKVDVGTPAEAYRGGLDLIYRRLLDLLARRGVKPIEALGTDFDPHVHQAVAYEPSPGHRDGEVIEELSRGYRLGDRLLRPAAVKVARA